MGQSRLAVMDLGTNTCKLLIVELSAKRYEVLYRTQIGVKIGESIQSQGIIDEEGQLRLKEALNIFQGHWEKYSIAASSVYTIATSAFRKARNAKLVKNQLQKAYQIQIEIISGDQEAEYNYQAIRSALPPREENVLICDIGGGSIEFIIANHRKILWKKSFPMGGQYLMDEYMRHDPMLELDIQRLEIYLETQFFMLSEAIFRFFPKVLVGSAGSFESLAALAIELNEGADKVGDYFDEHASMNIEHYAIDRDTFDEIFKRVVRVDRSQRDSLPNLPEFRRDMIVPAVVLIRFLLEHYELEEIQVSSQGIKEGFLASLSEGNSK